MSGNQLKNLEEERIDQGEDETKVTAETGNTTDKQVNLDSENEESDSEIDERPENDDVIGGGPRSNFGFALKRGNFNSDWVPKISCGLFTYYLIKIGYKWGLTWCYASS